MKKRILTLLLCLSLMFVLAGCGGSSGDSGAADEEQDTEEVTEEVVSLDQENEWVSQLEQEKQEAEQLYSSDEAPEEKASQASEKMLTLEEEYSSIMDSTGKDQSDYPLIRAYINVREMYVAIKHIAEGDEAEKYDSDYNQANEEATQIINDNYKH